MHRIDLDFIRQSNNIVNNYRGLVMQGKLPPSMSHTEESTPKLVHHVEREVVAGEGSYIGDDDAEYHRRNSDVPPAPTPTLALVQKTHASRLLTLHTQLVVNDPDVGVWLMEKHGGRVSVRIDWILKTHYRTSKICEEDSSRNDAIARRREQYAKTHNVVKYTTTTECIEPKRVAAKKTAVVIQVCGSVGRVAFNVIKGLRSRGHDNVCLNASLALKADTYVLIDTTKKKEVPHRIAEQSRETMLKAIGEAVERGYTFFVYASQEIIDKSRKYHSRECVNRWTQHTSSCGLVLHKYTKPKYSYDELANTSGKFGRHKVFKPRELREMLLPEEYAENSDFGPVLKYRYKGLHFNNDRPPLELPFDLLIKDDDTGCEVMPLCAVPLRRWDWMLGRPQFYDVPDKDHPIHRIINTKRPRYAHASAYMKNIGIDGSEYMPKGLKTQPCYNDYRDRIEGWLAIHETYIRQAYKHWFYDEGRDVKGEQPEDETTRYAKHFTHGKPVWLTPRDEEERAIEMDDDDPPPEEWTIADHTELEKAYDDDEYDVWTPREKEGEDFEILDEQAWNWTPPEPPQCDEVVLYEEWLDEQLEDMRGLYARYKGTHFAERVKQAALAVKAGTHEDCEDARRNAARRGEANAWRELLSMIGSLQRLGTGNDDAIARYNLFAGVADRMPTLWRVLAAVDDQEDTSEATAEKLWNAAQTLLNNGEGILTRTGGVVMARANAVLRLHDTTRRIKEAGKHWRKWVSSRRKKTNEWTRYWRKVTTVSQANAADAISLGYEFVDTIEGNTIRCGYKKPNASKTLDELIDADTKKANEARRAFQLSYSLEGKEPTEQEVVAFERQLRETYRLRTTTEAGKKPKFAVTTEEVQEAQSAAIEWLRTEWSSAKGRLENKPTQEETLLAASRRDAAALKLADKLLNVQDDMKFMHSCYFFAANMPELFGLARDLDIEFCAECPTDFAEVAGELYAAMVPGFTKKGSRKSVKYKKSKASQAARLVTEDLNEVLMTLRS